MRVFGKLGCGGPEGRGTSGARRSWSVAIFSASLELRRVRGAILIDAFPAACVGCGVEMVR